MSRHRLIKIDKVLICKVCGQEIPSTRQGWYTGRAKTCCKECSKIFTMRMKRYDYKAFA